MQHPKMKYTYVGIDSHKDTHTAVFLDCFFDKLGEIEFNNLPSEFGAFLSEAEKLRQDGTELLFGLEDTSCYGRSLMMFLKNNDQPVKHVNPLLVARERRNRNMLEKTDSVDAECAARVLLSKLGTLPDAAPEDEYWVLRTLVIRRDFIVRNNVALKNHLHDLLTQHYPNYRRFFHHIDCDSSLAFFYEYPSPSALERTTFEGLTALLWEHSRGQFGEKKAKQIWDSREDTAVPFQEVRDDAVRSTIRQLRFNLAELEQAEKSLATFLPTFETTLTTMNGISVIIASQLLSCIGDIKKFSTPAKLARYAGVAPVTYASGKNALQFANQRGNRELNSIFFKLALRLSFPSGKSGTVVNPFFYEYYNKKLSDGKTKRQALKCVQRRLVNIVWTMLTHGEEYVNPPTYEVEKKAVGA